MGRDGVRNFGFARSIVLTSDDFWIYWALSKFSNRVMPKYFSEAEFESFLFELASSAWFGACAAVACSSTIVSNVAYRVLNVECLGSVPVLR